MTLFKLCVASFCAIVLTTGCADQSDDTVTSQLALAEGSAEGEGVLHLLNDSSTTVELLDVDAHLNRRSATYLIAHRDGFDGVFGTADDDLFGDIAEVDAVHYVGASALKKLAEFAGLDGWVAAADEVMGTYDGVDFTPHQADLVIAMVNEASFGELDIEAKLPKNTVTAIVVARPVPHVKALAQVKGVGTSTLTKLRGYSEACAAACTGMGSSCTTY